MNKLLLFILAIWRCVLPPVTISQNVYDDSFYRYFTVTDTICLDIDTLLIGDIASAVILEDDKYVICDQISGAAIWIDRKAGKFKILDRHKDLPGVNMFPLAIVKDPTDGFWEAVPRYYLKYDDEANLISRHNNSMYFVSDQFCVDSLSNLLICSKQSSLNGTSVLYDNIHADVVEKLFKIDFSDRLANSIFRFEGGGILVDEEGRLYVANGVEDRILKYDLDGELIYEFYSRHISFKSIKKDIGEGVEGVMEFLRTHRGDRMNTSLHSIGFIDQNCFYAQYVDGRYKYVEIFNKNGEIINSDVLVLPEGVLIVGSYRGCIYGKRSLSRDLQPDSRENPYLIKYIFNPSG